MLEELGQTIPKTHDLEQLLALLVPHYTTLRPLRRGLQSLSEFAVAIRYPGTNASKRQAVAALRKEARKRMEARTILGIRSPRKRSL